MPPGGRRFGGRTGGSAGDTPRPSYASARSSTRAAGDGSLPEDGSKNPDIDIDFEAHRRDDVRNFFAKRYGKENVATVAAISTYQGRGIIRGIGKALMIPEDTLAYLAKRLHGSVSGKRLRQGIADRPELRDSGIPIERFQLLFQLAQIIYTFFQDLKLNKIK